MQPLFLYKQTDVHTLHLLIIYSQTHRTIIRNIQICSCSVHTCTPFCCMFTQKHPHSDHRGAGGGRPASPPAPPWFLWWRRWSEILLVKGWWWTDSWISGLLTPSLSHGSECPAETTQITYHKLKMSFTVNKWECYARYCTKKHIADIAEKNGFSSQMPKMQAGYQWVMWHFVFWLFCKC